MLLGRLLGREAPPLFLHHTLLVHPDGRKLSKAAADTSLRELRAGGATSAELIGEAALRAGLIEHARPVEALDVSTLFA